MTMLMMNSPLPNISSALPSKLGDVAAIDGEKLEVGHTQSEVVHLEKGALEKSWFTESDDEDGFDVIIRPRDEATLRRLKFA